MIQHHIVFDRIEIGHKAEITLTDTTKLGCWHTAAFDPVIADRVFLGRAGIAADADASIIGSHISGVVVLHGVASNNGVRICATTTDVDASPTIIFHHVVFNDEGRINRRAKATDCPAHIAHTRASVATKLALADVNIEIVPAVIHAIARRANARITEIIDGVDSQKLDKT